jgi:hypothetical protein
MFTNLWPMSPASDNLTVTNIKSANEQLNRMHRRIGELEQRIREQAELMHRRDQEHAHMYVTLHVYYHNSCF